MKKIQKIIAPVDDPRMSTVVYVVDVPGSDPKQAAILAADRIAEDIEAGTFHVLNSTGGVFEVDLRCARVRDVTHLPDIEIGTEEL